VRQKLGWRNTSSGRNRAALGKRTCKMKCHTKPALCGKISVLPLRECSLTCRNYGYTKNVTSLSVWQSNYIDLGTMRFPWLYLISCNRKFPIFTRPRLKHLQSKIIWYLLLSLSKYKHVLRKMGSRQEMASTLGS